MAKPMVSAAALAKAAGLTPMAISKAIQSGRVTAYSKAGRMVSPSFAVKLEEAKEELKFNRVRLDDDVLAMDRGSRRRGSHENLVDAKAGKEQLQSELLKLRLEREQGETITKAAATAAVETLARATQRVNKSIISWAEELYGAAQAGGLPAVSGLLRAKADELNTALANLLAAEAEAEAGVEHGD